MLYARPYGVLPCRISVGIKVFVHRSVRLFYLGVGATLEVHVDVLGEVPTQIELSVPQELRREGERELRIFHAFHVALLQFIVVSRDLRAESHVLRQPVETETLGYIKPFATALYLTERLKRFIDRRPVVVHGTAPVVLALIDCGLAGGVIVAVTV